MFPRIEVARRLEGTSVVHAMRVEMWLRMELELEFHPQHILEAPHSLLTWSFFDALRRFAQIEGRN